MESGGGLSETRWQPFWLRDGHQARGLEENLETDVVVIGGGITGASLAHHLRKLKTEFVLLERDRVGSGSTGRCAGGLAPGTELDFFEAVERFGMGMATTLWKTTSEAIGEIKRLGVAGAFDFVEASGLYMAKSEGDVKQLRREYEAVKGSGIGDVALSEGPKAREALNSDLNAFGILTYGGLGVVDPVKMARTLARPLEGGASGVFEGTPVAKIGAERGGFMVKTGKGSVFGKKLILATESYTNELVGRRMVHPIRVFSIMTKPVAPDVLDRLRLDGGKMVWDTGSLYNFIRVTKDARVLIDGGDTVAASTESGGAEEDLRAARLLRERLVGLFPSLLEVPVEYGWSGTMGLTTHRLPMIGEDPRVKNLFYSEGYGGHGLPFGFLAGRVLGEAASGDESEGTRECLEMFKPRIRSRLAMALEGLALRPYFGYLRMRG